MLAKLLASILDDKLQSWVPRSPEQFGFSWGQGTRDCLLTAARVFEVHGGRRGGLHVVFVDFKGAFDSVNRVKLLGKLDALVAEGRVPAPARDIIAAMYSNVHASLKLPAGSPSDAPPRTLRGDGRG